MAELCDRLDNLPLALELAAARTAVLTPDQILDRLGNRLDLLKGGRDADPRQQTLRATIAWSYDLLDAEERELFSRFAVFAGSASLEAIEEVCGAELDSLASLVDKSLVRRDGDRYWMLETLREYGRDQLEEAELEDMVESARRASTSDSPARPSKACGGVTPAVWLARVEHELQNLRAAMARALERGRAGRTAAIAVGIGRYWEARSSATEGRSWLAQALAAAALSDADRALPCWWLGQLAFFQGDLDAAGGAVSPKAVEAAQAGSERQSRGLVARLSRRGSRASGATTPRVKLGWSGASRCSPNSPIRGSARTSCFRCPVSSSRTRRTWSEWPTDGGPGAQARGRRRDRRSPTPSTTSAGTASSRATTTTRSSNLEEAAAIARELEDTFRLTSPPAISGSRRCSRSGYGDAVPLLREALILCIRRGDRRGGDGGGARSRSRHWPAWAGTSSPFASTRFSGP